MQNSQLSPGLRASVALEKHGFRTTHSLGQNFILDDRFLSYLLDLTGVDDGDRVLEIGPGPGVMTSMIAERTQRVVAVEMDEKLRPVLTDVLSGQENAEVVFGDAMRTDLSALVAEKLGTPYRVIANLPYYITADLILKILQTSPLPEDICLMVQKEAADRLMSNPGTKNWCALAATVRFFGECEILEKVAPHHFNPPPHVDSCFIRIRMREKCMLEGEEQQHLLKLIRWCFHMRRKTLVNNLKTCCGISQADAVVALEAAGLNAQVRGEALTLEEMVRLSAELRKI